MFCVVGEISSAAIGTVQDLELSVKLVAAPTSHESCG